VEFDTLFGSGINKLDCLVDAAEAQLEVVEHKGWGHQARGKEKTSHHISR